MKKLFTLLIFSFLFTQVTFAQSEKTFVKSMTADASNVVFDLEGNAEVSEWNEKFIRITTTVEVTNFNEDILKRLVSVGRYEFTSTTQDGVMTITLPKIATKVTIRGQMLTEILKYEIFVPAGTNVELATPTLTVSGLN